MAYQKRERDPSTGITVVYDCSKTKPDPRRPGYLVAAGDNEGPPAREGCSMTAESQRALRDAPAGGGATTTTTTAPAGGGGSGAGVSSVLTGVGAILGPLANAFATGYSAKLQVDFQKDQLRNQGGGFAPPPMPFIPLPPPRSNTGLIVGGVFAGLLVVGGILWAVLSD